MTGSLARKARLTARLICRNCAKLPQGLLPAIQAMRTAASVFAFNERLVQHTYCGFPLTIAIADSTAEKWYDRDMPMLPEIALLQRHRLGPGSRVFDMGSHQGVVALILARIVGDSGAVVAVEANKHNVRIAHKN